MATEAVRVQNLEKRFGRFVAVDRISFQVARGEIFGLLGPNGAGKSTTIRMLCGIITPSGGTGHVAGLDIISQSEAIKSTIGYMSQKFSLYQDLTPLENIRFYLGIYNVPVRLWRERMNWVLAITRLQAAKERLTRDLPPGWRQRLALGCALLHRPGILFLDEPTSGVDPITRRHFWDFIRELTDQQVTVFVTTHYMDAWGGSNGGKECRKRLAHDDKHRIVAAILRKRDHLVRERPAIQGHLLHSLVNMALILHLKLIG